MLDEALTEGPIGKHLLVLSFAASGPTAEQKSACMSDVMRFCFSFNMNMDAVGSCLKAHKSQLSPRCRALYEKEEGQAAAGPK